MWAIHQTLEESQWFEWVIQCILLAIDVSNSSNSGDSISDWVFDPQSLYLSWKETQRQAKQFYQWLCNPQSVYPSWKRKQQQHPKISFMLMILTSESNFGKSCNLVSGCLMQPYHIFPLWNLSMTNDHQSFYGEGGKPFTCVTVPLTAQVMLSMEWNHLMVDLIESSLIRSVVAQDFMIFMILLMAKWRTDYYKCKYILHWIEKWHGTE